MDSLGCISSSLEHSLKVLFFDMDAVFQTPEQTGKYLPVFFFGDCFVAVHLLFWRCLGHEKASSQLLYLSREKKAKACLVQSWNIGWGKTLIFLSFKILNYNPCFVGTCIFVEKVMVIGCWQLVSWTILGKTGTA